MSIAQVLSLTKFFFQVKAEKKEITNVIGPEQTRKHNLVTVMFFIVAIFLFCNLAEPSFFLYRVIFHMQKRPDTCFLMITINASINAFVYGIFSPNYQKTLLKLICRSPEQKKSVEVPQINLETLQRKLKTQKSL